MKRKLLTIVVIMLSALAFSKNKVKYTTEQEVNELEKIVQTIQYYTKSTAFERDSVPLFGGSIIAPIIGLEMKPHYSKSLSCFMIQSLIGDSFDVSVGTPPDIDSFGNIRFSYFYKNYTVYIVCFDNIVAVSVLDLKK